MQQRWPGVSSKGDARERERESVCVMCDIIINCTVMYGVLYRTVHESSVRVWPKKKERCGTAEKQRNDDEQK